MRKEWAILVFGAIALAGCAPTAPNPSPPPVAAAPAGPPPPAGVIAGPLGAALTPEDRQTAFDAQIDALDKGQRRSWKGKNVFGFIEPGPETAGCRDYKHTVFVDGRANSGSGKACVQPDGSWKF
jgi:surface antigen